MQTEGKMFNILGITVWHQVSSWYDESPMWTQHHAQWWRSRSFFIAVKLCRLPKDSRSQSLERCVTSQETHWWDISLEIFWNAQQRDSKNDNLERHPHDVPTSSGNRTETRKIMTFWGTETEPKGISSVPEQSVYLVVSYLSHFDSPTLRLASRMSY